MGARPTRLLPHNTYLKLISPSGPHWDRPAGRGHGETTSARARTAGSSAARPRATRTAPRRPRARQSSRRLGVQIRADRADSDIELDDQGSFARRRSSRWIQARRRREDDTPPDNARDNIQYAYCVQSLHGTSQFGRFGRPQEHLHAPSKRPVAAQATCDALTAATPGMREQPSSRVVWFRLGPASRASLEGGLGPSVAGVVDGDAGQVDLVDAVEHLVGRCDVGRGERSASPEVGPVSRGSQTRRFRDPFSARRVWAPVNHVCPLGGDTSESGVGRASAGLG